MCRILGYETFESRKDRESVDENEQRQMRNEQYWKPRMAQRSNQFVRAI